MSTSSQISPQESAERLVMSSFIHGTRNLKVKLKWVEHAEICCWKATRHTNEIKLGSAKPSFHVNKLKEELYLIKCSFLDIILDIAGPYIYIWDTLLRLRHWKHSGKLPKKNRVPSWWGDLSYTNSTKTRSIHTVGLIHIPPSGK